MFARLAGDPGPPGTLPAMDLTERLPLRPELNFRDVGGYETVSGGRVRRGAFYRSANLVDADADERGFLASLAIRTVCDLRAPDEAAARPSPLAQLSDADVLALGVVGGRHIGDPATSIIAYGFQEVRVDDIAGFYRFMVDEQPRVFGQVVEAVAQVERHAVVVHCSAGKDRTGIACALVLSTIGVSDEVVVADYELTSRLWAPAQIERARPALEEAGLDVERVATYFHAPAQAMYATLAHLRDTYGSIEGYLTGPAGLSEATLTGLVDALVEEAATDVVSR